MKTHGTSLVLSANAIFLQLNADDIAQINADAMVAIKACVERGDKATAEAIKYKLNLVIRHNTDLVEKAAFCRTSITSFF